MKNVFTRSIALALSLSAAACGGSDSSSTAATPTVVAGPSTELFEGKLQGRGDSTFFSFTVGVTGNVSVTLASVTTTSTPGSTANIALGVGLGSPLATDCNVTTHRQRLLAGHLLRPRIRRRQRFRPCELCRTYHPHVI